MHRVPNEEKDQDAQAGTVADERREPGQLTKEEAKQLLDALKNDERKVPAISQDRPRRPTAQRPKNSQGLVII